MRVVSCCARIRSIAVAGCRGRMAQSGGPARMPQPLAVPLSAAGLGSACQPLPASAEHVSRAAAALVHGLIIAVPTDTLYGVAACARSAVGIQGLYALKVRAKIFGRDARVPLAVCVADVSDVAAVGDVSHLPDGLLECLLPGPVTIVLRRRAAAPLSSALNPGAATVGVRVPDSNFVRAVCRARGGPVALTSANPSGGSSTVDVTEFAALWHDCAAVFDGGRLESGRQGSTVIDLSRPGVGGVRAPRAAGSSCVDGGKVRPAAKRHRGDETLGAGDMAGGGEPEATAGSGDGAGGAGAVGSSQGGKRRHSTGDGAVSAPADDDDPSTSAPQAQESIAAPAAAGGVVGDTRPTAPFRGLHYRVLRPGVGLDRALATLTRFGVRPLPDP